ncbi:hypothetical protein FTV88_0622 [Heliorestis convoluta]|uniref:Uncharacterized protein n=1 Tax=Heliorestis convoluta TaxID=356322 RepID=A0A5Q2MY22_9FIRM|nr:hypothetical protein FTV88_0622 [Heliorestis convoluta]
MLGTTCGWFFVALKILEDLFFLKTLLFLTEFLVATPVLRMEVLCRNPL